MKNFRLYLILVLLALNPSAVFAAVAAGKFLFVFGKVDLEMVDGSSQPAKKGTTIYEGTVIRSHKTGKAQIKLVDGGFLAIRPNTHLKIDEYSFNQKGREDKGVVSLIKGTFRTISGAIAKENKEKVVVKTPIATIGIRGTDHEPAFIPVNDPAFPPDMPPGLYDKVNSGATFIENDAGRLNLGQEDIGFVAQPDQPPVKLDHVPAFFQKPNVAINYQSESEEGQKEQADQPQSAEQSVDTANGADESTGFADDGSIANKTPGSDVVSGVEQVIKATDASGNTVNLDEQTVTAADGTVSPVQSVNTGTGGISAHMAMLRYDSSAPAFKVIEMTEFIDGVRDTILRDLSGHVYGGYDAEGNHIVSGLNEASKVSAKAGDHANNGIEFGMYTADKFDDFEGSFDLGNRYLGWITGPVYQSSNLTGSTLFSFDGGLAYGGDLNATWSPLNYNAGNTHLVVDFGANTSTLTIDVGAAGNKWLFNATNLPFIATASSGEFNFDSPGAVLSMQLNGDPSQVFFDISGSLVGKDDGAMFSFAAKKILNPADGVGVSGVVSFDR
jgi:hypothetical protein